MNGHGPSPAGTPAKKSPAGPGLHPNHSASDSERNTMVGNISATVVLLAGNIASDRVITR